MEQGGSRNVEFRTDHSDDEDHLKTVVAFSNCAGGRIVFGIDDDRTVVGIPDDTLFKTMDSIADSISASCSPTISPNIFNATANDRNIIVVGI